MSEQRSSESRSGAFEASGVGGLGRESLTDLRQAIERESASLMRTAELLAAFVRQHDERYAELERELNDTALLYVASYQLHARDEPGEVLGHVRELLEQLVGAECFALYLGESSGMARPVMSRGLSGEELVMLRMADEPLLSAFTSRSPVLVEQSPLPKASLRAPLAVIPLMHGDRALGAIFVVKLFGHKVSWAQVDPQLFQLLSAHAGSALVAAHLYQTHPDLLGALAGLGESLK